MGPIRRWSRSSPRHRRLRASSAFLLLVVALHGPPPVSAGVFGRRSSSAAIFGNLLGQRDSTQSPAPSQGLPPPPPPPPPPLGRAPAAPDAPPMPPAYSGDHHHSLPPPQEDRHWRQLTVLTERIIELETIAAADRNVIREWQQNCTRLMEDMETLQEEKEAERKKCREWEEQYTRALADQDRLKEELKVALREAEDLAALIEKHRLMVEDEEESFRRKKTKKKRGLLAWFFGWGTEAEDDLDDAYEEARSTLLKALQTERNIVDELESAVASLQQNNSAIAEQVSSRDTIIDELNDRIAIFEEDKIVLKAALKQLQKEIKEEAPKTQKLAEDYKAAQKEIKRLQKDIERLVQDHQTEVKKLEKVIADRVQDIRSKEGNLTEIGTYVDKLESRLADFAVARRDIEKREETCRALEKESQEIVEERDRLKLLIAEYETEREEHKKLLKDLVAERTTLKSQSSRGELEQAAMRLRGSLAKLEIDYTTLDKLNQDLQTRLHDVEVQKNSLDESKQELVEKLETMEEKLTKMQATVDERSREKDELLAQLEKATTDKVELTRRLEQQTRSIKSESLMKDEKVKEMEASLLSSVKEVESLQAELMAVRQDFEETLKELERTQQLKRRLEASLRDLKSQQETKNTSSVQIVISRDDDAFDEFDSDPRIHIDMKNLLPTVLQVPCRPRPISNASVFNASASVLVPLKGVDKRTLLNTERSESNKHGAALKVPPPSPVRTASRADSSIPAAHNVAPPGPTLPGSTGKVNAGPGPGSFRNKTGLSVVRPTNATANPPKDRHVPLREVRKFFSRTTGIHGLFTKPSVSRPTLSSLGRTNSSPRLGGLGALRKRVVSPTEPSQAGQPTRLLGSNVAQRKPQLPAAGTRSTQVGPHLQQPQNLPTPQKDTRQATSGPSFFGRSKPTKLFPSGQRAPSVPSPSRAEASLPKASDNSSRTFGGGLMQPPPGNVEKK